MSATQKIRIPIPQRLADFRRGPLVFLVWLAVALGAGMLLWEQPRAARHWGWVPPVEATVTSAVTGRLETLLVERGQLVEKGELLAQLDVRPLEARLATVEAEAGLLVARLEDAVAAADSDAASAEAELARSTADELRRFTADRNRFLFDETDLRLDQLRLEVNVATDGIEIERIDVRLRRATELMKRGIGPEADVEELTLNKLQVTERLRRTRVQLDGVRRELAAASRRRNEFLAVAPHVIGAARAARPLAALHAAMRVQEMRVHELREERNALALRSPIAGRVARVLVGDGQAVRAGVPIFVIESDASPEAVIFVIQADQDPEQLVGRDVELCPRGRSQAIVARIASSAPRVVQLPERLWPSPTIPQWGVALRVPIGAANRFLPGEVVGARLLAPGHE